MRGFGVETLAEMRDREWRSGIDGRWFLVCCVRALRCGREAQDRRVAQVGCSWLADGGAFSRAAAFGKTWGPGAERALTTIPSAGRETEPGREWRCDHFCVFVGSRQHGIEQTRLVLLLINCSIFQLPGTCSSTLHSSTLIPTSGRLLLSAESSLMMFEQWASP